MKTGKRGSYEKPVRLDMPFGAALERFAQTDPKEVREQMETGRQLDFKAKLNTIDFHGDVLEIVDGNGRPYVPVKRICENLGIDWNGQQQRIRRDQVLSEGACMIHVPSAGGDQEMQAWIMRQTPSITATTSLCCAIASRQRAWT